MSAQATENQSCGQYNSDGKAQYFFTAGAKNVCLRYTASSTRKKLQYVSPVLKSSKTSKFSTHGGKSTGPKTAEGKQRIAQAQLKHGSYSKAGIEAKQAEAIQLRQLEDIAVLIGMIQGPRTLGCKPRGYKAITSMEAVKALVALK